MEIASLLIWIKATRLAAWWVRAPPSKDRNMPPEAAIFTTAVVIAFCLLMGTLAWVLWYTRDTPRPTPRD